MGVSGEIGWRRGGSRILTVLLAAGLAAGGSGVAAASGGHAADQGRRVVLGAGQTGTRAQVPWRRVGAGWVLSVYWPGRYAYAGRPVAAAATLYLLDPAGGRYRLFRWAATRNPPVLMDWSGDKSRALLISAKGQDWQQVVLATGKLSRIGVPAAAQLIGYTRPRGDGLLGWQQAGSRARLATYRLTGALDRVLAVGPDDDTAVFSPSGAAVAVAGAWGVQLVSGRGGVIRALPVPGTGPDGCVPSRWWNSATILASCYARGTSRGRLWLVPASGARPRPLTPQRGPRSRDPGDVGAWRLPAGLYLQAVASSGAGRIFRQASGGTARPVTVRRTAGNNWVLAARGPRLLISAETPCYASASLLWLDPATGREQFLLTAPGGRAGVVGSVPYGQPVAELLIAVGCVARPSRPAAVPLARG